MLYVCVCVCWGLVLLVAALLFGIPKTLRTDSQHFIVLRDISPRKIRNLKKNPSQTNAVSLLTVTGGRRSRETERGSQGIPHHCVSLTTLKDHSVEWCQEFGWKSTRKTSCRGESVGCMSKKSSGHNNLLSRPGQPVLDVTCVSCKLSHERVVCR